MTSLVDRLNYQGHYSMTKTADDFRMGVMLDHDHTMRLLELALAGKIDVQEALYQTIDVCWMYFQTSGRLL